MKEFIEDIKIFEYYNRWLHSGSYAEQVALIEIIKNIEKKINEIIKRINKE